MITRLSGLSACLKRRSRGDEALSLTATIFQENPIVEPSAVGSHRHAGGFQTGSQPEPPGRWLGGPLHGPKQERLNKTIRKAVLLPRGKWPPGTGKLPVPPFP